MANYANVICYFIQLRKFTISIFIWIARIVVQNSAVDNVAERIVHFNSLAVGHSDEQVNKIAPFSK